MEQKVKYFTTCGCNGEINVEQINQGENHHEKKETKEKQSRSTIVFGHANQATRGQGE